MNIIPKEKLNAIEHILCAAIWYDDGIERAHLPRNIKTGIVACGWRHGNCFTVLNAMFPNREYIGHTVGDNQGFLTSKGRYVNRKEAGDIAFKAGQISKENDFLFSEDLY